MKLKACDVEFTALPREVANRFGIDNSEWDVFPHVAWMGITPDPKVRGMRRFDRDGVRYRVLGMGGLLWRAGLCWLWLNGIDLKRTNALKVVRSARSMLQKAAQLGEKRVVAARDEAPRSEGLLKLLGFERWPDDPAFQGKEIWVWPRSQPSQP